MEETTVTADVIAQRIKDLVGQINNAISEATVAGIVVNVSIMGGEAKGVGPSIEVELLKRL
jgi:hypothetical protein